MLSFFRKHQRFFFIIITTVTVISFCFFGTLGSGGSGSPVHDVPNRVVVKGINGSDIMQHDLSTVCRMIGTSPLDRDVLQKGVSPNLLNDSVIEKDLIAPGMAMILSRHYFEELRPDLEKRLLRVKNYRPYTHPQYPQISAEAVWRQFLPALSQHLGVLRAKSDQLTVETLAVLFQLYLDQTMLPADFLKQVLAHQLNQQGLAVDPLLTHADLSLFGFHSLEDWFGPRFVELAGQFVMNAALFARDNGYQVSNEAVRADLYQNIVDGYRSISRQDKIQADDIDAYYQRKMRELGVDEQQMLQGWRQVMLFRRLFQDVGNSVLLDPLPLEQFHRYTKEALKVDLYELPSHLQLKSLSDVFKLQLYLEAVSLEHARQKNSLSLSQQFASVEQIDKKAPELVESQIEVEYAEVRKDALLREISLKETWDWEVQDASWRALKLKFPQLASSQAQSALDRYKALDLLDAPLRRKVDAFAQESIIDQHPERIAAALDRAAIRQQAFGLRGAGSIGPFHQIKDHEQLAQLLRSAPLRGAASSSEQQTIQEHLNRYSEDQNTFYRIAVLSRNEARTVLTFAEAQKDGTLDQMLDKRLEAAYPDVRRKSSAQFQKGDGTWKPYRDVKEKVGRLVFVDLLKAIEDSNRPVVEALAATGEEFPSSFYVQNRLYSFMNQVKGQVEAQGDHQQWIREDSEHESTFAGQWKLLKRSPTIERNSDFSFAKEQMFEISAGSWSPVAAGQSGSLSFYQVLGSEHPSSLAVEEMSEGHQLLSLDAQRTLLLDLIKKIEEKKAIDLTASLGEDL